MCNKKGKQRVKNMSMALTVFFFLCACGWSPYLAAMRDGQGCWKSFFQETTRAELLEYYKEAREEDGEEDTAESSADAQPREKRGGLAKTHVEHKLASLLSGERREVFAQHLPEQVLLVLDRVRAQHRKLYDALANKNDSGAQREEHERELMGIMLFELCTSLGQENQDLADMCRGQDSWVGCCKWYWAFMGAASLATIGVACYAPFAPCGAWHG